MKTVAPGPVTRNNEMGGLFRQYDAYDAFPIHIYVRRTQSFRISIPFGP